MVVAEDTAKQLEEVAGESKIITDEVMRIADTLETQTEEILQIMMWFSLIQQRSRNVQQQVRR